MKLALVIVLTVATWSTGCSGPQVRIVTPQTKDLAGCYENRDIRFRVSLTLNEDGTYSRQNEDLEAGFEETSRPAIERGNWSAKGPIISLIRNRVKEPQALRYRTVVVRGQLALAPADSPLEQREPLELLGYLFRQPDHQIGTTTTKASVERMPRYQASAFSPSLAAASQPSVRRKK